MTCAQSPHGPRAGCKRAVALPASEFWIQNDTIVRRAEPSSHRGGFDVDSYGLDKGDKQCLLQRVATI